MKFEEICKSVRRDVAKMMHRSLSSHIGGCYSITEILVTLYFEICFLLASSIIKNIVVTIDVIHDFRWLENI